MLAPSRMSLWALRVEIIHFGAKQSMLAIVRH